MRAVCFVNRIEFEFSGNVFQNALALGDVDNDGENELIVGNLNGELAIFKHDQLWHKLSGLGMITAIAVGDILNCKANALVVVSGDGWVHIFTASSTKSSSDVELSESKIEKLTCHHVQRIPANTKVALLKDIDSDGNIEFLIGLTDRVVRSYRWLPARNNSPARLQVLNKWECANQVGTMTVNKSPEDGASLLVSQPGGSYMKICCNATHRDLDSSFMDGDGLSDSSVEYHPLSLARMRNANVSTEILGGIEAPMTDVLKTRYAVATLDGTIMLVDNEEILWSLQVDNQVFSLKGLDVTGDGMDEIIACAWNGQTYILDQEQRSVMFQLEEAVSGFTAGMYVSQPGGQREPCLVYTTFTNKVYVYRDVRLPSMVTTSIRLDLGLDDTQSRELVEWCLHGPNQSMT